MIRVVAETSHKGGVEIVKRGPLVFCVCDSLLCAEGALLAYFIGVFLVAADLSLDLVLGKLLVCSELFFALQITYREEQRAGAGIGDGSF